MFDLRFNKVKLVYLKKQYKEDFPKWVGEL